MPVRPLPLLVAFAFACGPLEPLANDGPVGSSDAGAAAPDASTSPQNDVDSGFDVDGGSGAGVFVDAGTGIDSGVVADAGAQPVDAGAPRDSGVAGGDAGSRDAGGVRDAGVDAGAVPNRVVWFFGGKGWLPTAFVGATNPPTLGPDTTALAGLPVTVIDGLNLGAVHPSFTSGGPAEDCAGCLLSTDAQRPSNAATSFYREPTGPTFDFILARAFGRVLDSMYVGPQSVYQARSFGANGLRVAVQTSAAAVVSLWGTQPAAGGCALTAPTPSPTDPPAWPFLSVVYQGIRCDLTRFATVATGINLYWPQTMSTEVESSHMVYDRKYQIIQQQHAATIAGFARRLSSTPTPDGMTLLDHTLIIWMQDAGGSDPSQHRIQDLRFVVVGSVPGFRSGQHLKLPLTTTTTQFHTTIARALGLSSSALPAPYAAAVPITQLLR